MQMNTQQRICIQFTYLNPEYLRPCACLLCSPICQAVDIIHLINTCSDDDHSAHTKKNNYSFSSSKWTFYMVIYQFLSPVFNEPLYNSAHPWNKDGPQSQDFHSLIHRALREKGALRMSLFSNDFFFLSEFLWEYSDAIILQPSEAPPFSRPH